MDQTPKQIVASFGLQGKITEVHAREIEEIVSDQLQKARQDRLREEIVRLEGMKEKEFHMCAIDIIDGKEVSSCPAFCTGVQHNQAIQTIQDRYQAELDQDNK